MLKEKEKPMALDSLLKLLPVLAISYPGITSLLGQLTGDPQGGTGQIQEVIPKITQRLAEMDQETKDELARQIYNFFPELQELMKRE